MVALLALGQSHDCPSASKTTLKNFGENWWSDKQTYNSIALYLILPYIFILCEPNMGWRLPVFCCYGNTGYWGFELLFRGFFDCANWWNDHCYPDWYLTVYVWNSSMMASLHGNAFHIMACCEGNPPVTGRFSSQSASDANFLFPFVVRQNNLQIKQLISCPDSKVHGANMGLIWADRTQVGPMLAPWTLLSGWWF